MKITTNNQPRSIVYWFQLTDKEKLEFDYLNTENSQECALFFRYKGNVYHLSEFENTKRIPEFKEWDGYLSDSFFSGILVRFPEDQDSDYVVVGWYCE